MAKLSVDEVRTQAQKLVSEEPTITNPSRIIATVERIGPILKKRMTVTLEGKVQNEAEKRKAEQVLDSHFRDAITINNNLEVGPA
ncbi:MAG: hypothetical protein ACLFM0_06320 [Spirochaetales bacterium]